MSQTQAFERIAAKYDRARPGYPDAAMQAVARTIRNVPSQSVQIADVGAGTGIFTRLLRAQLPASFHIVGVEPGHEMRRTAEEHGGASIRYVDAPAEQLPFGAATLRTITVAQALQWFDRPVFYGEAGRCLDSAGLLFVVQNNRRWSSSSFLDAYECLLETYSPGYDRDYRKFDVVADVTHPGSFVVYDVQKYAWEREMSAEQFRDMSFSSTKMKAAVDAHGAEHMGAKVEEMIARFFPSGKPIVPYDTEVYAFRSAR